MNKALPKRLFIRSRLAIEQQLIELSDLLIDLLVADNLRALEHAAHLLNHERAVEHEQRLLRHGGGKPPRAGLIRAGKIKVAEDAGKILAIDERVNRPARRGWV